MKIDEKEARELFTTLAGMSWQYRNVTVHRKVERKLCKSCEGLGYYTRNEVVDYHRRDYADFRYDCIKCDGDGRVVEVSEYVTYTSPSKTQTMSFPAAQAQGLVETHESQDLPFTIKERSN